MRVLSESHGYCPQRQPDRQQPVCRRHLGSSAGAVSSSVFPKPCTRPSGQGWGRSAHTAVRFLLWGQYTLPEPRTVQEPREVPIAIELWVAVPGSVLQSRCSWLPGKTQTLRRAALLVCEAPSVSHAYGSSETWASSEPQYDSDKRALWGRCSMGPVSARSGQSPILCPLGPPAPAVGPALCVSCCRAPAASPHPTQCFLLGVRHPRGPLASELRPGSPCSAQCGPEDLDSGPPDPTASYPLLGSPRGFCGSRGELRDVSASGGACGVWYLL